MVSRRLFHLGNNFEDQVKGAMRILKMSEEGAIDFVEQMIAGEIAYDMITQEPESLPADIRRIYSSQAEWPKSRKDKAISVDEEDIDFFLERYD